MNALKKIWLWLRKYWFIPIVFVAGIIILVLSIVFTRKPKFPVSDILKKQRDIYEEEKEKLNKVEKKKIEDKQKLEKDYQEVVKKLDKNYDIKKETLTKRKQNKIKEILKKDKKDLHKNLSSEFGIIYVE